ncbi:SufD family Fe-S cluster assembly protein [Eggerthellaceae bacterium zg-1084]|uniref:SufB/SufD family protein n=1 Tax=Berryella wangjianweii TaxID=2734634 RepID=UPI00155389DC|nr:SufD family Fe-S cluster assembly protein [Berryella wangjianweii]NPD30688.1 SufD family Fe-S cluster assembly protein [Berryella wangjianweii]
MGSYVLERVNAMPAPTWHRLRMNHTDIEVPGHLEATSDLNLEAPADALGQEGAFERALDAAQAAWLEAHPTSACAEDAADAETFDGCALSAYQQRAQQIEDARDIRAAFETGMGPAAERFLTTVGGEPVVIQAAAGARVRASVRVAGIDGAINVAPVDVVAGAGSQVELVILVDSPESGEGFTGTALRVFAGADAQVSIVRTQTLDEGWVDLDNIGLFADARARIEVRETVLGAGKAFGGIAGDLRGEASSIDIDLRYLGHGSLERDFNYTLRHHGPKTECTINANGVLAGSSKKTLRGTIDLIRGCKGASGQENETVLLVDDDVVNLTVPVILCSEDDVAGNHGATIGHVRPEQMFYLGSRGLSQEDAERMFVSALMEQAVFEAPDSATRTAVLRLGDRVVGHLSALMSEEGEVR